MPKPVITIHEIVKTAWYDGMGCYHDTKTSKKLDKEFEDFMELYEDELIDLKRRIDAFEEPFKIDKHKNF